MLQPLRMFRQLEDLAAIDPFALEHAAGIMQAVRQDVAARLAPGDQAAVHPDHAVTIVEWNNCHGTSDPSVRLFRVREAVS